MLAAVLAWWLLQGDWDAVRVPMLLVVGAFVALFPARVFNAVLQGVQDLAFVGRLQLTVWAVGTGHHDRSRCWRAPDSMRSSLGGS